MTVKAGHVSASQAWDKHSFNHFAAYHTRKLEKQRSMGFAVLAGNSYRTRVQVVPAVFLNSGRCEDRHLKSLTAFDTVPLKAKSLTFPVNVYKSIVLVAATRNDQWRIYVVVAPFS